MPREKENLFDFYHGLSTSAAQQQDEGSLPSHLLKTEGRDGGGEKKLVLIFLPCRRPHTTQGRLGSHRRTKQTHHNMRGGTLRGREGEGIHGHREVVSLQPVRGSPGG